jgi:hypothetical protein
MVYCKHCKKRASYGIEFGKPLYCADHKEENMLDVINKRCIVNKCPNRASYGITKNKSTHCKLHKEENMFNCNGIFCKDCNTRASFGLKYKKPLYCVLHKKENMFNVVSKRCIVDKCPIIPTFGIKLGKPLYCEKHKEENMISVIHKKCKECPTRPTYGLILGKPTHCVIHKTSEMFDVNHPICKECDTRASFGLKRNKPTHCVIHKLENMFNVIQQNCLFEKCFVQPCFGYINNKPLYCVLHKLENMVNLLGAKCKECPVQPTFGLEKGFPTHCFKHKTKEMFDVRHDLCTVPFCDQRIYNKELSDKYCLKCYCYINPTEEISKKYKTKENIVFKALIDKLNENSNFDSSRIFRDKIIDNACSRRRPDFMYDCYTHWICAENDENQHDDYDTTCENKRSMELFEDMGNRPMILIRFNCDSYIKNKKRYPSLFITNTETNSIVIANKETFEERINVFSKEIEKYLLEQPTKEFTQIFLYYNQ